MVFAIKDSIIGIIRIEVKVVYLYFVSSNQMKQKNQSEELLLGLLDLEGLILKGPYSSLKFYDFL